MAGIQRLPAGRSWSLTDSYGFISMYITEHLLSTGQLDCVQARTTVPTRRSNLSASQHGPTCSRDYFGKTSPHLALNVRSSGAQTSSFLRAGNGHCQIRCFHDYFVTHLPSSSLHPDSRSSSGPHHKLPRSASSPHKAGSGAAPAAPPPMRGPSRELTVVRIPLRSAKHHFGASFSRGMRPYNEDTYQAGTIDIPAFAKKGPVSLSRSMGLMPNKQSAGEATSAGATNGDPQVFYFGVFDGHGGSECSEFLREELHEYIENASSQFDLKSNLKSARKPLNNPQKAAIASIAKSQLADAMGLSSSANSGYVKGGCDDPQILELENTLIDQWKETVGGYFRRFKPQYFCTSAMEGGSSKTAQGEGFSQALLSIEKVLMYAFLRADLDFVTAQATKPDPESGADLPLNHDEVLGEPSRQSRKGQIGGPTRFKGGSTASIAMISTPTPTPFWNPSSPSTLVVAHVGDTRILLCETSTGLATAATTNHHPSTPVEGTRLRRYAAAFVTDSFGEERMSGLANTRAFGDMRSKRIGVSAEPEIRRYELGPAQYSFLALVSDGVSGTLSDQEIVDVIKEAKTPEQGARDVVAFATEVSKEGDNATCLVVRLGGWERRGEGGMGSLGTKEIRDYRRQEATDPRSRRT